MSIMTNSAAFHTQPTLVVSTLNFISPHTIWSLTGDSDDGFLHDRFMLLGLFSIWKTRMSARRADIDVANVNFRIIVHSRIVY